MADEKLQNAHQGKIADLMERLDIFENETSSIVKQLKTQLQGSENELKRCKHDMTKQIEDHKRKIKDLEKEMKRKGDVLNETKSKLNRITNQKADTDKQLAQVNARVKELTNHCKHTEKENEELIGKCKELKYQIEQEQRNVCAMNYHFTEEVKIREAYMKHIQTLKEEKKQLDDEKQTLLLRMSMKEDMLLETNTELSRITSLKAEADKKIAHDQEYKHQLYANVQELTSQYKQAKKENEELENQIEQERENVYTMDNKLTEAVQQREAYMDQLQILCKEKKQIEAEKQDLLQKFPKVAGENMPYSNPGIPDLSDEKRPTRLAEDFSELFDNEWTDAFEELVSDNKEKIAFMLKLIMRANQLCIDISNRHVRQIKDSLSTLSLPIPAKPLKQRNKETFDVSTKDEEQKLHSDFELLRSEQKNAILEAENFFVTMLSDSVETACTDMMVQEEEIDRERNKFVVKYIKKCVNICLSMCWHEPPVHIDFPDLTKGDIPFDTGIYKPYTKTGTHVAFIVWPAMYLYKGGPVLSKGVAQGKNG